MSENKLIKYLRKEFKVPSGTQHLTPILLSDSKGFSLQKQASNPVEQSIKLWCKSGRNSRQGLEWLQENLATQIGRIDNISLYVWLGTHKNFELNLDKAIARKLEATKRPVNVTYKLTGGGLTAKADTVSFELMKNAIIHYYEQLDVNDRYINIKVDKDLDKKGLTVGLVIRVIANDTPSYTLSVYYTSCSLLVNGRDTIRFFTIDLPEIHKTIHKVILNGTKVDLQSQ
ncbi:unnamed protein product [Mytilus edulis]|uniref:Uncharacterized protein n=1 Tax=Mytilus edulis TaxID=6550 RepID=A0A8S3QJF6_MYTED|nr:unnamed protein product [Mytilus edulis]